MFLKHLQKKICYIIMICVLFFGMCSTRVDGHSLFMLKDINSSVTAFTGSVIRPLQSDMSAGQVLTRESIGEQEVFISSCQELRKGANRAQRGIIAVVSALLSRIFVLLLFITHFKKFNHITTISGIIIRYIHLQDGDKHRLLLA